MQQIKVHKSCFQLFIFGHSDILFFSILKIIRWHSALLVIFYLYRQKQSAYRALVIKIRQWAETPFVQVKENPDKGYATDRDETKPDDGFVRFRYFGIAVFRASSISYFVLPDSFRRWVFTFSFPVQRSKTSQHFHHCPSGFVNGTVMDNHFVNNRFSAFDFLHLFQQPLDIFVAVATQIFLGKNIHCFSK